MLNNITRLREIELELLENFISVCNEHHLKWFAMFGTLLGAMRCEGFLPWDDDIDVAMPLEDYKALCRNKEWFNEKYFLQTPIDEGFPRYAKLRKNGTTAFCLPFLDTLKKGGHSGIALDIIPLNEPSGLGIYSTPTLMTGRGNIAYPKYMFESVQTAKFEHLQINIPCQARRILDLTYGVWSWPIGSETINPHYWFFDTDMGYEIYFKRYTKMLDGIKDKKIYLFGAADSLRIWLERFGLIDQVVCTFDNDSGKWGKTIFDVEVRNPQELPELIDSDSRVIIVSLWYQEIGKQLESMGIRDYFVFLDYYFEYDKDGKVVDHLG